MSTDAFTPTRKLDAIMAAFERTDLTAQQKVIAAALVALADKTGSAAATNDHLCRLASIKDRETGYAAVKRLESLGLVAKTKGVGKSNAFRVLPQSVIDAVESAYTERQQTSRVEPDYQQAPTGRVEPVGLNPTTQAPTGRVQPDYSATKPVGLGPTCRVEPDGSRASPRAQKESPSGIVNINRLSEDSHPLTPSAPAASAVCEGEILGPNEELLGHGVISNCETIRHAAFVISIPSIEIGALAAGMSRDEVKQHCISHALQWAAEIESGKPVRDVVPAKIANFLSASLMGVRNRSQRVPRAPSPNSPRVAAGATGESQLERTARQVAAARARLEGRA